MSGCYDAQYVIDEEELASLLLGKTVDVETEYAGDCGHNEFFNLGLKLGDVSFTRLIEALQKPCLPCGHSVKHFNDESGCAECVAIDVRCQPLAEGGG